MRLTTYVVGGRKPAEKKKRRIGGKGEHNIVLNEEERNE